MGGLRSRCWRALNVPTEGEVTRLLAQLSEGRIGAEEALLPLVYDELHSLAHQFMRGERPGHTLQTTALVHEAYLRLGGEHGASWESRAHFLRMASKAMRRILIDHARRKRTDKKGGERKREPLDGVTVSDGKSPVDVLLLNSALEKLAEVDPRTVEMVELRFFGGLTVEETAKVMGVSPRMLMYDWRMAKAWLRQELGDA